MFLVLKIMPLVNLIFYLYHIPLSSFSPLLNAYKKSDGIAFVLGKIYSSRNTSSLPGLIKTTVIQINKKFA